MLLQFGALITFPIGKCQQYLLCEVVLATIPMKARFAHINTSAISTALKVKPTSANTRYRQPIGTFATN